METIANELNNFIFDLCQKVDLFTHKLSKKSKPNSYTDHKETPVPIHLGAPSNEVAFVHDMMATTSTIRIGHDAS